MPQKNPPGNSPAKSSKIHTKKSPTHFCRGAGPTKELCKTIACIARHEKYRFWASKAEDFPYDNDLMPAGLADERNLDFPLERAAEYMTLALKYLESTAAGQKAQPSFHQSRFLGGGCDLAHRNRSDFCDLRLRCPSRTPEIARFPRHETAMMHCDLRVRWKVASDLRFRAAISEPKTPSFCGISGDLAPSTRKSLAIAIVRFWCAKGCDEASGGVRVWFRVRFQAVKVPLFGGFPVQSPTNKAIASKLG